MPRGSRRRLNPANIARRIFSSVLIIVIVILGGVVLLLCCWALAVLRVDPNRGRLKSLGFHFVMNLQARVHQVTEKCSGRLAFRGKQILV